MREWQAEPLVECGCTLGEGIQWDGATQRLYWTDIHGRRLLSCEADGGALEERALPEPLGSFAFDPAGHLLCAFASGLFRLDLAADRCDRQGRFVVGGMDERFERITSLIRYSGRTELLRRGIGCTNSIAFAPNGRWMYFADTTTKIIERYAYDPATGALGTPEVFLGPDPEGHPDGSCVDADGHLWNARFNGAAVLRISPAGEVVGRVSLPVPQITCACFGGPALDRLYITTARERMDEATLKAHPLSGAVFHARPGMRGLPESRYGQSLF
ncbi:MAG TPA: SMP-30/gluconolactonase/LRE family protein [Paracoccaceae bacterium]|nr:SMP-30/gluconolactonase/LRE family protein [Paracoccaceae bacterium]